MPDAVLAGVETRTSSPLRVTRGKDCQSVNIEGLYPVGEGAGYAGGILSAGVDGVEVAEAVTWAMLRVGADQVPSADMAPFNARQASPAGPPVAE